MSSQTPVSTTQMLQHAATKIAQMELGHVVSKFMQKMKPSMGRKSSDSVKPVTNEIQAARSVTLIRPTAAPQIIDLRALKRNLAPQPTLIYIPRSTVQPSRSDPVRRQLRHKESFANLRSPTVMGAALLLEDPQRALVFETTPDGSAAGSSDDVAGCCAGYELLDDEDSDMDRSLLDLPEVTVADCTGYEIFDDGQSDLDWSLLDLPEKMSTDGWRTEAVMV